MKGIRGERMGEEIRRELAEILRESVRDPGLGLATVTRVEVSADLAHARVLVSFLGDDAAEARGLRALERAASYIRTELAHRLRARRTPELSFRADHGIAHSFRIQSELRDLGLGEEGTGSDSAGDEPATGGPDGGEDR